MSRANLTVFEGSNLRST